MTARWLAVAAAASLTLHLRAAYQGPEWQVYLFKPLTTSLVLLLALTAPPGATTRYRRAIGAGLALSLVGDVLLMLPGDRFVAGLIAFLAAHLAYLAAFSDRVGPRVARWPTAAYLACGAGVLAYLWPGDVVELVIDLSRELAGGARRGRRSAVRRVDDLGAGVSVCVLRGSHGSRPCAMRPW